MDCGDFFVAETVRCANSFHNLFMDCGIFRSFSAVGGGALDAPAVKYSDFHYILGKFVTFQKGRRGRRPLHCVPTAKFSPQSLHGLWSDFLSERVAACAQLSFSPLVVHICPQLSHQLWIKKSPPCRVGIGFQLRLAMYSSRVRPE